MNKIQFDRRKAIVGMGAALMMSGTSRAVATESDIYSLLAPLIRDGKVTGLHTLLAARGGRLLIERYWQGEDWNRGIPLGQVASVPRCSTIYARPPRASSVCSMASHSPTARCRRPKPSSTPVSRSMPILRRSPAVTASVAHVLSMTLGTAWDELTFPYSDPRNSEIQMDAAPDRYRFILERPVVSEPGVKWTYCGGATALLGRVIAKGTGQSLPDFARRAMFEPLGLGPTDWTTGRDGEPLAASGLRMRAPDLLRVGQMVLGSGLWQGRQIVSAEWLKLSTEPVVEIDEFRRYGWHWYLVEFSGGTSGAEHAIAAIGWGGQRLFVFPSQDLVIAMNAGNYRLTGIEQAHIAATVMTEAVLPWIRGAG